MELHSPQNPYSIYFTRPYISYRFFIDFCCLSFTLYASAVLQDSLVQLLPAKYSSGGEGGIQLQKKVTNSVRFSISGVHSCHTLTGHCSMVSAVDLLLKRGIFLSWSPLTLPVTSSLGWGWWEILSALWLGLAERKKDSWWMVWEGCCLHF